MYKTTNDYLMLNKYDNSGTYKEENEEYEYNWLFDDEEYEYWMNDEED